MVQLGSFRLPRPIGKRADGRGPEGIRKLNTMMRVQSGSLCQSGNRRIIGFSRPIGQSGNFFQSGNKEYVSEWDPIGQSGVSCQSGNRAFTTNRTNVLNRAGCPNRAIATIRNWMPLVQSVPIGSQSGRWSQSGEKTSQ